MATAARAGAVGASIVLLLAGSGCTNAPSPPDFRDSTLTGFVTGGGRVTANIETPLSVSPGADRVLVRWVSLLSGVDELIHVRVGEAFVLPEGCRLPNVSTWTEVKAMKGEGTTWPDYPRVRVEPGGFPVSITVRRDIPESCVGKAEVVVGIDSPQFASRPVTRRIPIILS